MKHALRTLGRSSLLAAGLLLAASAWAQMTPVGTWQSIDDQTNQPRTEVVISEQGGVLSGRITRLLRPGADQAARCTACTDDRKDQPMIGLEIIRGAPAKPKGAPCGRVGASSTPKTAAATPCA